MVVVDQFVSLVREQRLEHLTSVLLFIGIVLFLDLIRMRKFAEGLEYFGVQAKLFSLGLYGELRMQRLLLWVEIFD